MTYTIGALARRTDISIATVRFYERRGLLSEPPRNAYGHRQYDDSYVRCITFIRRSQALGFTLAEIKELLSLREAPGNACEEVKRRASRRLDKTKEEIETLYFVRRQLQDLVERCDRARESEGCPALELLEV